MDTPLLIKPSASVDIADTPLPTNQMDSSPSVMASPTLKVESKEIEKKKEK